MAEANADVNPRDPMPRMRRHIGVKISGKLHPMRKLVLEFTIAIALTLGAILAFSPSVLAGDVMVMGAFARASAMPTAKTGAVYMTLMNQAAAADRLVAVATDVAAGASLHQSVEENGVAKMLPVDSLEIPPGGSVELKPGSYHIMLMGLKAPLKKGGMLMLQLEFEHAGVVEVMANIGEVAQDHAHTEEPPSN